MFTGLVETMGTVSASLPLDATEGGGGGFSLTVSDAHDVLPDVKLGDSISIQGACMTVTEFDIAGGTFKVGVSPETLRKTNLGELVVGSKVNLERAMRLGDRFGGHIVQGHVDCCVKVHSITPDEPNSIVIEFVVPKPRKSAEGKTVVAGGVGEGSIAELIKAKIRKVGEDNAQQGWVEPEVVATSSSSDDIDENEEGDTEAPTDIDYLNYIVPKGFITLDGTSLTVIDVDTKRRTFSVMLIKHTQERVTLTKRKVGDRVNIEVDQMGKYAERAVMGVLERLGLVV